MKVAVLLADKGTVNPQVGTLNLLNVGWQVTHVNPQLGIGAPLPPQAVAIFYEVDFDKCNRDIELKVELVNQDGNVIDLMGPAGPQPMILRQQIRVSSVAGMPNGSPGSGNLLLEFVPGPVLEPGGYEWRVTLAGVHNDDWSAKFHVMAPPQAPVLGN